MSTRLIGYESCSALAGPNVVTISKYVGFDSELLVSGGGPSGAERRSVSAVAQMDLVVEV